MDFSSTEARATLPAGRGKIFGWGFPRAGSAGSRGSARCEKAGLPPNTKTKTAKRIEINERLWSIPCLFVMSYASSMDWQSANPAF